MAHVLSSKQLFITAITCVTLLTACTTDDNGRTIVREQSHSVHVQPLTWVYYSLENGCEVGTSSFGDAAADSLWKYRTDWDFAICGDLIRTNGGTSGVGQGGLLSVNKEFDQLTAAPDTVYAIDREP